MVVVSKTFYYIYSLSKKTVCAINRDWISHTCMCNFYFFNYQVFLCRKQQIKTQKIIHTPMNEVEVSDEVK